MLEALKAMPVLMLSLSKLRRLYGPIGSSPWSSSSVFALIWSQSSCHDQLTKVFMHLCRIACLPSIKFRSDLTASSGLGFQQTVIVAIENIWEPCQSGDVKYWRYKQSCKVNDAYVGRVRCIDGERAVLFSPGGYVLSARHYMALLYGSERAHGGEGAAGEMRFHIAHSTCKSNPPWNFA